MVEFKRFYFRKLFVVGILELVIIEIYNNTVREMRKFSEKWQVSNLF